MAHKAGFCAVVGRPNVGKSTLINTMIGEKIAITSPKPQTTRGNMRAILSEEDYQVIFLDTPGIHSPRTKLGEIMTEAAESTLKEADVILFVCDATDRTLLSADRKIIELIDRANKPVILVLNKIDLVQKELLLGRIAEITGLLRCEDVIPISALKRDGVDIVVESVVKALPEGPSLYDEELITDTSVRDIAAEIIREKLLLFLKDEVPHGTGVEIVRFIEGANGKATNIDANIYCEKETHKAMIIGDKGSMLTKVGTSARKDIEKLVGTKVNLKLWVKVREDWRNNAGFLKSQGFRAEN